MSQCLFLTIQFHYNFFKYHGYSCNSEAPYTSSNGCVYIVYISPACLDTPPPPSSYSTCTIVPSLSSSPRYHTNITRSPRDCDPVISTSFTLGLPCQWERERGLEESEKERENKKERGREREREGKGKETLQCQRVERKSNK